MLVELVTGTDDSGRGRRRRFRERRPPEFKGW